MILLLIAGFCALFVIVMVLTVATVKNYGKVDANQKRMEDILIKLSAAAFVDADWQKTAIKQLLKDLGLEVTPDGKKHN